jgi:hypothetical protein
VKSSLKTITHLRILSIVVLIFAIAMVVYWTLYLIRGMPTEGIPILSEILTALLALVTAFGLLHLKKWSVATALVLAGMWSYAVLGGINLIIEKGLNFASPFGAITDAIIFPIILLFSLYFAYKIWINRNLFIE